MRSNSYFIQYGEEQIAIKLEMKLWDNSFCRIYINDELFHDKPIKIYAVYDKPFTIDDLPCHAYFKKGWGFGDAAIRLKLEVNGRAIPADTIITIDKVTQTREKSLTEQIEELSRLHKDGTINDEEYAKLKDKFIQDI